MKWILLYHFMLRPQAQARRVKTMLEGMRVHRKFQAELRQLKKPEFKKI